VNSGHLANLVSQSFTAASGALLQRTLSSLATCGTAMKKQTNHRNPKKHKQKAAILEDQEWKHQE
jgi:hypothetical protein